MVVSDAYMLSEVDDGAMGAQLAALQRVPSADTHRLGEQLRSVCLGLLCAAMQWDEFRCGPSLSLSAARGCMQGSLASPPFAGPSWGYAR